MESQSVSGIQRAVELAGSQSDLARLINVSPQAVQQWFANGVVPAKRVADVARETGVPMHELNPESHPLPAGPQAVADEPSQHVA